MKRVDQDALMIALEAFDLAAELASEFPEAPVHFVQRNLPVEFRFAGAQHVQVGTVKDQDAMHRASDGLPSRVPRATGAPP